MKNGSLISCSSSFSFKTFFKYFFRFVIEIFTGDKVEHVAIHLNGKVAESVLDGGIRILEFQDWLNHQRACKRKIYENRLNIELTDLQINQIDSFIKKKLGSKYSIKEAISSVLSDKIDYQIDNKAYCSEFARDCYLEAGILPLSFKEKRLNPAELIRVLKEFNLIESKNII